MRYYEIIQRSVRENYGRKIANCKTEEEKKEIEELYTLLADVLSEWRWGDRERLKNTFIKNKQ